VIAIFPFLSFFLFPSFSKSAVRFFAIENILRRTQSGNAAAIQRGAAILWVHFLKDGDFVAESREFDQTGERRAGWPAGPRTNNGDFLPVVGFSPGFTTTYPRSRSCACLWPRSPRNRSPTKPRAYRNEKWLVVLPRCRPSPRGDNTATRKPKGNGPCLP